MSELVYAIEVIKQSDDPSDTVMLLREACDWDKIIAPPDVVIRPNGTLAKAELVVVQVPGAEVNGLYQITPIEKSKKG